MLKNYFKVAIRYLFQNKGYTTINILGLAIGIACCLLIMLFVRSEWSFDRFHTKSDRIYRAWINEKYEGQEFTNTVTPIPLGPTLSKNIPDIEASCRVYVFSTLVQQKNERFNELVNMVDSNFFQVFDFELINGDATTVFSNSNAIVLTEAMAKKYFGNTNAVGKILELQLGNEVVPFTVSALVKSAPEESSIDFDMLIPHSNEKHLFSERAINNGWTSVYLETYLLFKPGVAVAEVEHKMPALVKQIAGEDYVEGQYNIHFQPMTDIHLNKSLPAGNLPISDPSYSYILATIGILILLIACINFVTLSVGRSVTRAMEVGVRKVLGAERLQVMKQFWGEAFLLVLASFVVAIAIAYLALKPFNTIANKEMLFAFDGFTMLYFICIIAFVSIIAGIYPALVLSSFKPIKVLKGVLQRGPQIGLFRKGLIVGQFVTSILMIISTMIIGQQMNFLRNKNLGFDKEHLVIISTNKPRTEGFPLAEKLKVELEKNPQVLASTTSMMSFSEPGWVNLGYRDDDNKYRNFRMNAVDADFTEAMNLQLVAGRSFSKANPADQNNSMLVNETLVKEYGWKDAIGKKLPGKYRQEIIGVVKDFHYESLHDKIKPLALVMNPDSMFRWSDDVMISAAPQPRVTVRLAAGDVEKQIAAIKAAWKLVAGEQDFEYRFLDESLNAMYREDARLSTIVRYASYLSIFIACMGLFGLATLSVARRTKEIGIRKVLGAGIKHLVTLLSRDFVLLVCIASVIAFPIAWWSMNSWLQDFAYRTQITWWSFIAAGLTACFIALLTVSFHIIKAAIANPVKSLRTE